MTTQDSLFQAASNATMSTNMAIALRNYGQQLRVAMPAQVKSLDGNGKVTVQPGFQTVSAANLRSDGKPDPITLKPIGGVPIMQPQGAGYAVKLPVAVGDTGLLIFADRSIDPWMAGDGGPQDPNDPRLHDLTDAVFVPGLLTTMGTAAQTSNGTDLVLQNGLASLHVQAAGTYKMGNGQQDLVALVYALSAQVDSLSATLGSLSASNGGGPIVFTASDPTTGVTGPLKAAISAIVSVGARIRTLVGT